MNLTTEQKEYLIELGLKTLLERSIKFENRNAEPLVIKPKRQYKKRGKHTLNKKQRLEISARMKKMWADKRKAKK